MTSISVNEIGRLGAEIEQLANEVSRLRLTNETVTHINAIMDAEIKRLSAENARLVKENANMAWRIEGLEK